MQVDKLFDVKGKIVLVTGGGRGVGEMIAAGYVANGAKVSHRHRTLVQGRGWRA
jgi:NAD(P)-dependent dehydrogenase (short-subunit alcohol dehydrogenase family)